MGICGSKSVSREAYCETLGTSSVDESASTSTPGGIRARAVSPTLSGLAQGALSRPASPSQWSSVKRSIRRANPSDRRFTRAVAALGAIYSSSPTFRRLAEKIWDEGGVTLQADDGGIAIAATDATRRAILVSPQTLSNFGTAPGPSLVSALVFEMNNLARANEFNAILDRVQYDTSSAAICAQELERIEYSSSETCGQIFREARDALRAFGEAGHPERWFLHHDPHNASLQPLYSTFEEYLAYQQQSGHTQDYEQRLSDSLNHLR